MEDTEQLRDVYKIATFVVSTIVLFAMGVIFYQFRWVLYLVGFISCACSVALIVEFTIRRVTRYTYRDISQTGTIAKPFIGKPKTFAPIGLLPASKEPTIKVTPVVPTLKEMLAKNLLDGVSLYHGYEIKGSEVIPLIGSWNDVRTFCVAGKGGSGKTIRLFFILIQCILGNATIYLCDPHGSDAGSITALLQPLARWVKFAVNDFEGDIEAQIMAMVSDFHARMERRRHNQELDRTPCVLVIDEFTSLIMNDLYGESVVDTVCACADQYRKYGGYAVVVGQSWTLPAKGKTTALLARLRKSLHAMFVHRLHADYAKYFFSDRKRLKGIDHLKTGLCVFVDTDGQLHDLHTPKGSVTDAFTVASMMQTLPGPNTDQLQLASPRLKEQIAYPYTPTGPLGESVVVTPYSQPYQLSEHAFSAISKPGQTVRLPIEPGQTGIESHQVPVRQPVKPGEMVTPDDEQAILKAYFLLDADKPGKVTRSDILAHLNWNNKRWSTLKAVCDKYGIAC